MNRNAFSVQIAVALGLSAVGALMVSVLGLWLGTSLALLCAVIVLAGCYLVWLYVGQSRRGGLSLVMLAWLLIACLALAISLSVALVLVAFTGMIWLARSSLRYRKPWLAACDALLSVLSVGACIWVALSTHSLFLSCWSFFLIQALTFFIPEDDRNYTKNTTTSDRFSSARCNAEAALKRM